MKKTQRLELEAIAGFVNDAGTLKLRIQDAECIGRNYDQIEQRAYPPMSSLTQADMIKQMAERQNEMLAKLQPMVDGIVNDPNDPRAKMMQQVMGMFGGLPPAHNVDAMHADVLQGDTISQQPSDYRGIEVEITEEAANPAESAKWISVNFGRLIPGFVEAAKYSYSILEDEQHDEACAAAYLVKNPSDQDFLDRIRILSMEIGPEYRYVFSLETPSSHLEEHGMYAVFNSDKLLACGEYDVIAELTDGPHDEDDED